MYDLILKERNMADEEIKNTETEERKCFGLKEKDVLKFVMPCVTSFIGCILALAVYASLAGKPPLPPRHCPPPPPCQRMEMPNHYGHHHYRHHRGEFKKHHPDFRKDKFSKHNKNIKAKKPPISEAKSTPEKKD